MSRSSIGMIQRCARHQRPPTLPPPKPSDPDAEGWPWAWLTLGVTILVGGLWAGAIYMLRW